MSFTWGRPHPLQRTSTGNIICGNKTGTVFIVDYVCGDVYRLLDDVEMGGGDTQGHGKVLALHMLKQLKSSQKFSELLTEQYDSICRWLNCLEPIHKQLTVSIFVNHKSFLEQHVCMH